MACWSSWKTFSCRSRSRVTSAIDHTVMRASRRVSPMLYRRTRKPAAALSGVARDAHFLLQPAPLSRSL